MKVHGDMTHRDNAAFTITTLHDDPDLSKMGASTSSLVQLSEAFRLARQWSRTLGCCDHLDDRVQDLDMQSIPGLDTRYAIGMARRFLQIYLGPAPQIAGRARGLIREEIAITGEMKDQP
jgi:hypothetical protein